MVIGLGFGACGCYFFVGLCMVCFCLFNVKRLDGLGLRVSDLGFTVMLNVCLNDDVVLLCLSFYVLLV